ncbi:hypothetical protein V8F20_000977 [Naviculisporaceae sp. PSN 640]
MFDVDWTDYNAERVGQRRARKEIEKDLKKKEDSRSAHDSVITRSSSSSGERHYGLLESIGLKKPAGSAATRKPSKPSSLALRSISSIKDDDKRQRNSVCAPPSNKIVVSDSGVSSSDEISPKSAPPVSSEFAQSQLPITWRSTTNSLQQGLLSPKPLDIAAPASTPHLGGVVPDSTPATGRVVQSLGSNSYITKTTELVYEPRKGTDTSAAVMGVSIEAKYRAPQSPAPASPISRSESPLSMSKEMSSSKFIDKWWNAVQTPVDSPPPALDQDAFGKSPSSQAPSRQPRRPSASTPTRSPRKKVFALVPPSKGGRVGIYNPDAWKPPDTWNCPADKTTPSPKPQRRFTERAAAASNVSLDLEAMKKEIKKMAGACPQSILVKLNEEWGNVADAAFYKKLEMERKRWMLSALDSFNAATKKAGKCDIPAPDEQKVLALFESQSTTAYLAAFYGEATITHLSPSPLSHVLFPNVHPLLSTINPVLPLAANSFTSIHCLTLPSMMASQDIPLLLKNIHRCLAANGTLHLNLIDPVPISKSLGPRMRDWFDQNLMLNIEKNFRCTNPCRLLPDWLGEAHLRGPGSQLRKVTFLAVASAAGGPSHGRGGSRSDDSGLVLDDEVERSDGVRSPAMSPKSGQGQGQGPDTEKTRKELTSMVGRLLWREVWGSFVHGSTWWWEDPEIVEECLRLDTRWEYWMIDSTKEDVVC